VAEEVGDALSRCLAMPCPFALDACQNKLEHANTMEVFDDVSESPALITLEQTILTFGRRGSNSGSLDPRRFDLT
jgi:hypothetical protein